MHRQFLGNKRTSVELMEDESIAIGWLDAGNRLHGLRALRVFYLRLARQADALPCIISLFKSSLR